jgi:hypothetical protein
MSSLANSHEQLARNGSRQTSGLPDNDLSKRADTESQLPISRTSRLAQNTYKCMYIRVSAIPQMFLEIGI